MIVVLGGAVSTSLADDRFPINVYPCPRAEAAPVLDGKLDDAVWQRAALVSDFTLFGTDKLASPRTAFRMLWDDNHLYLGVQCDEPQMDKIVPMRFADDGSAAFANESMEFFVDPDHTHGRYFQLMFNIAGRLYCGGNGGAEVKIHLEEESWSVEVAVPWAWVKATPKPGKVVGFNVNRNRSIEETMNATWARVQGGFHDPDRFAHLVLSGTPELIDKLSGEFRRGSRTGPIVVYGAGGPVLTSHAERPELALGEARKLLADLEAQGRKEKKPEAAEELKRRLDEYRKKLAALKSQGERKLDAADWTRVDLEMQALVGQLRKTVAEAGLPALLKEI